MMLTLKHLYFYLLLLPIVNIAIAADNYYYVGDQATPIVYSDSSIAIEIDNDFAGWEQFIKINPSVNPDAKLSHLPNGMYRIGLHAGVKIESVISNLKTSTGIKKVRRIWIHPTAGEIFPSNGVVVKFRSQAEAQIIDSIVQYDNISNYRWLADSKLFCYLGLEKDQYREAVDLGNRIYESGLAELSCFDFAIEAEPLFTPNDPLFKYSKYLENDGSYGGTIDADIDIAEAWEYVLPFNDEDYSDYCQLQIAILDDGLSDHEDLGYICGEYFGPGEYWDFDNDPDGFAPSPDQGHGQAIAGILSGLNNNGIGVSGILRPNNPQYENYNPFFLTCRVICDTNTLDPHLDYSRVAEALLYAGGSTHILSISWSFGVEPILESAINALYIDNGLLCVCAAGNRNCHFDDDGKEYVCDDDTLLVFPAEHPYTLSVGATDEYDIKWIYSQWGKQLDVMAPSGDGIFDETFYGDMVAIDQMGDAGYIQEYGANPDCYDTTLNYDYFCRFGGTSAAAPQVAGIAMLLLARRPDLFLLENGDCIPCSNNPDSCTAKLLKDIIKYSCEDVVNNDEMPGIVDTSRINDRYGYGRVNAARALLAVSHGDVDNDGTINLLDVTYTINYLYKGGPPPNPNVLLADADCNGRVNILDVTYLINYLYNGTEPAPPICFIFKELN